ncbi:MAG: helix-turn-helix domain-containing protein [Dissulfurispiraceae bacterium]|jgi:predicted DNA-binding transcriptional regulator AlpA
MDDLIDVSTVAKILKMSKAGVFGLVHKKKINCIKLSRRCLRFDRHAIQEWINSKTQLACEQPIEPKTPTTPTKRRLPSKKNGRQSGINALVERVKAEVLKP